jgi:hypothetical protein
MSELGGFIGWRRLTGSRGLRGAGVCCGESRIEAACALLRYLAREKALSAVACVLRRDQIPEKMPAGTILIEQRSEEVRRVGSAAVKRLTPPARPR